jgi:tRNA uridine 5-carboxymethylaminomethyl modification enzyme
VGAVSAARLAELERTEAAMRTARAALEGAVLSPSAWARAGVPVRADGELRSAFRVLAHPDASLDKVAAALPAVAACDRAALERVAVDARYAGYLERQEHEVEAFRRDEALALPDDLDYHSLTALSAEARERLAAARPATLGAAGRIHGVTPPVLTALLKHVRRPGRPGHASL